ncbi:hypothetical protein DRQ25_04660 [Candidatus Fermentibacteria bacterium]|nr:MAG: hypothetical protein DRQ25_04660 [Candidatus Fermentibacteria bacterium]
MQRNIVEFISILRRKGLRVSISESIDSINAVLKSNISSKRQFRNALQCTLIKDSDDHERFNRIFDIYFSQFSLDELDEMKEVEEESFRERLREMEKSFDEKKFEEKLKELEDIFEGTEEKEKKEKLGVEELRDEEKNNSEEVHGGDDIHGDIQDHERDSDDSDGSETGEGEGHNDFEAEIDSLFSDEKKEDNDAQEGNTSSGTETNQMSQNLEVSQTLETTQKLREALQTGDFSDIKDDLIRDSAKKQAEKESKERYQNHHPENIHFSSEFREELKQAITEINEEIRRNSTEADEKGDVEAERIQKNIEKLRKRYNDAVDEELRKKYGMGLLEDAEENLIEKDFAAYTEKDYEEVRKRVQKLAKKIRGAVSRKQRQSKRGRIDVRRTIRASIQHGGTPLHLKRRNKKYDKPDIVMLCDLSGSVSIFSEFMLTIMKALEDKVSKFEAFAFVDTICRLDLSVPIAESLRNADVSVEGYSDFGNSFMEFHNHHLSRCVDKKTTVIILGDARNNRKESESWTLQEMQEKAKTLLWLNPERKEEWDTGDSIMTEYAQHCNDVFQCSNLRDVEKISRIL